MENIKTIDNQWDVPLIGVSECWAPQLRLFLRKRDIIPVRAVLGHLQGKSLSGYLGGKIVANQIFERQKGKYDEVTLVGIGKDEAVRTLVRDLEDVRGCQFKPDRYSSDKYTIPSFHVSSRETEMGYHDLGCFNFDGRFLLLTPAPGTFSRTPSPIDLFLISKNKISSSN